MTPRRSTRTRPLTGSIRVPGDKSISHRALMLSALAEGPSSITGLNRGDDVARSALALQLLGAGVTSHDLSSEVKVEGWGARGPAEPAEVIDAGNSGTTARLLMGIVAALHGTTVITGDESLRRRPMLRVVAPLRSMGATVDGREHGDRLPVTVRGGDLVGCDHVLSIASAQVKSALLLAGLAAEGTTSISEPGVSRDHTERMLRSAGVAVNSEGDALTVAGGQRPEAMEWSVPGDISSAMYMVVAAALREGSSLAVKDVGLNPTRAGALQVLADMGADIVIEKHDAIGGEARGDLSVRASELHATEVMAAAVPALIDEIPVLAVAASQAEGQTVFRGVGELKAKESDRLNAIVSGLRALGGDAETTGDVLVVRGPTRLSGGPVDSGGDHRMAMSFAVAGVISDAPIRIHGWSCVDTSFPSFLEVLGQAQGGVR